MCHNKNEPKIQNDDAYLSVYYYEIGVYAFESI